MLKEAALFPRNLSSESVRTLVIPFYCSSGSAKAKSYGFLEVLVSTYLRVLQYYFRHFQCYLHFGDNLCFLVPVPIFFGKSRFLPIALGPIQLNFVYSCDWILTSGVCTENLSQLRNSAHFSSLVSENVRYYHIDFVLFLSLNSCRWAKPLCDWQR
jgi:hypothetical protein